MICKLNWKQCHDRYDHLQELLDKEDGLTHLMSGIGDRELSELNELLLQMREAKDDLKKEKHAKKDKVAKEEEEKERIGKALVAASLSRNNKLSADYRCNEEGSESDSGVGPKDRNKDRMVRGGGIGRELAKFGESLKESDMARLTWSVSSFNSSGISSMWRMRSAARNGKNVVWRGKRIVNWT
ncbi:hypothetical protein BWQ96_07280 [Gracilariopsis chorda]|uniref:Uncharacterized protein n=1 Tax=Gracilariopsis chorda TaxID=448386 RepID=A0A2V3ILL7_9FLOR|nr:hypothetical protein BWQ96_07280 [Gracilariopsis chorda]|eukprot:PXF42976.1 hypothetical protein BWQ96_07280 [Gracilariopsis chorda]